jgi:protein-S-isoprenylcysteine O-methyltransferase Ste14
MATEAPAPWFFKQRFALFGAAYGLSFLGGFVLAGILDVAARPVFLSSQPPSSSALVAAAFVVGGYALRLWASSFIAATIVWTQDVQLGDLTLGGPYRFTRNPLYLGNLMQAIGIGMLGPWPVLALSTILILAYCFVLIAVEEPYLARKNGTAYARYRAIVPQFFPVPGKAAPADGRPGSWRDGLRSEAFVGALTAVVLVDIAYQTYRASI